MFIYLGDFFLKIAYFKSSKFAAKEIWFMYKNFLWIRPAVILASHSFKFIFDVDKFVHVTKQDKSKRTQSVTVQDDDTAPLQNKQPKSFVERTGPKNKVKLNFSEKALASFEFLGQLVNLPIATYTGFGRLVNLHHIKTNYLYFSYGQELILHNLPLTMLQIYNNVSLDKVYSLDRWNYAFSAMHLIAVATELSFFRMNLNNEINLEKRFKFSKKHRIVDTARISCVSWILFVIVFVCGWYLFPL